MKKTKIALFILMVLLTGIIILGCASVSATQGYASTLEEAHPDRTEKTIVGMSLDEFKEVWPEATRIGFSEDGETYEFVYTHIVGGLYGNASDYRIHTNFYFTNNSLTKYESQRRTF